MKRNSFAYRHIGPKAVDVDQMLTTIGVDSIDTLIDQTVPTTIRSTEEMDLAPAMTEAEFSAHITALGEMNSVFKTYIGMGYHNTVLPGVIQRNILENPGWYTAYTPYQAEIAQGRLEALFNFQTVVCDLTGMELANASLLDESTAAAEAMNMLFGSRTREQKKQDACQFFVDENILPQTLSLLKTRANPMGIELTVGDPNTSTFSENYFGSIFQYPGKNGALPDLKSWMDKAQEFGISTVVAADIMSLVLLENPGSYGADVVVGTTQRFGIPLGYGGPHAAFFATKSHYKRNIPGRIIGQTKDLDENPALRMALQTREQHIKRDRATSNICTAQVLLAVMAGMYAVYHGPNGLSFIARNIHNKASQLNTLLKGIGLNQKNDHFFDTLQVEIDATAIKKIAEKQQLNFYYPDTNTVCISLNETTSEDEIQQIASVFAEVVNKELPPLTGKLTQTIPNNQKRKSLFLTHAIFNSYHSETALMRYIKSLERKDLALNHSMISLGSCTMKLNAAYEMLEKLTKQLNVITGFAATSLQPNSGAQGEYSGLMVIRAYHESRNDSHRNICLIPASAHGTNPASAVMAGMKVVVTGTDDRGNIDWNDLHQKAIEHKDNLAGLMITYPSTHGVFEAKIKDITKLIHDCGGQVYMDGANMNAQVGLTSPAEIGADVCHLNLHKTFAIPHGGGGPGVGPICVAKHLADFLPQHPLVKTGGNASNDTISAAPWGSALACLISYGYIKMLGAKGLTESTKIAILNANYIKHRLQGSFDTLYSGEQGRAAH